MSSKQRYACPHCLRDNFKSARGLTQHLACSKVCAQLHSNLAKVAGNKRTNDEATLDETAPKKPAVATAINSILAKDFLARQQIMASSMATLQRNSHALPAAHLDHDMDADFGFLMDDDSDDGGGLLHMEEEEDYVAPPNSVSRDRFREYVADSKTNLLPLDKYQVAGIKLMDVLQKKKTSLDTYNAVMDWHLRDKGLLHDHESLRHTRAYLSRKVLIKTLGARYNMTSKLAQPKTVILPSSRAKVTIHCHNAYDMVESILTDPRFQDKDWLFFDNDPFAPPPDDLDYISDINTGTSYIETYRKLIKDPKREILVPIVLYIDGAVTGQFDKLQITALQMTLGILNRQARDQKHAWRHLGYVSNYAKEQSRSKKMFFDSGHIAATHLQAELNDGEGEAKNVQDDAHKSQDYHTILGTILQTFPQLFEEGMKWDFSYRGQLHTDCLLKFFIPFVKCDTDEADKLCGSYTARGANVSQLCRYCCCPTNKTDLCLAKFPYKTVPMIKNLVQTNNLTKLQELSQQYINNCFHDLRFGLQNNRGIHGACPLELLHALLLGIFKYV
jgi:hypothetical protein